MQQQQPLPTTPSASLSCRYAEYDVLRPLLAKHLQYSDSILVLGPGTSALHEQLYERCDRLKATAAHEDVLSHTGCGQVSSRYRSNSTDRRNDILRLAMKQLSMHAAIQAQTHD
jgi:16S rRNA A1518/A1519 N6-dimethyltransferase RsmA/KsgA/DIM1 with predicted DNA glycosylase/AP lyase activity